ncbi:hypothetical protein chiPu_0002967 [Chiloscyllium punctatum]|uniref:Uncharacterized protein n=1 Tax=Chiloscyllium punctatum TaxID=137246 RepID=A0A401S2C1_CHIPU|nr:hypothetical protein [Chiloscyllium punctatum]
MRQNDSKLPDKLKICENNKKCQKDHERLQPAGPQYLHMRTSDPSIGISCRRVRGWEGLLSKGAGAFEGGGCWGKAQAHSRARAVEERRRRRRFRGWGLLRKGAGAFEGGGLLRKGAGAFEGGRLLRKGAGAFEGGRLLRKGAGAFEEKNPLKKAQVCL